LRSLLVVAGVSLLATVAGGQRADAKGPSDPESATKPCAAGFLHVVVRGRHVCRPAADLRVSVSGSPGANRAGGTFTFDVRVANRGRRGATNVRITLTTAAELVSVSAASGTCSPPSAGSVRCDVGSLSLRAQVAIQAIVRGTALGALRVGARATSSTLEARRSDNAATGSSQVTEPDSVRGRGSRPLAGPGVRPPVEVDVDAISGPSGHDPTGTFWTRYPAAGPEFRGRVVCLTVSGNRASVGGVIEQSSDPANPPGTPILFAFIDNGDPGVGRDATVTYFGRDLNSAQCPVPIFREGDEIPLSDGNFVVRDVQP
jgi:hypothetical protein